MWLWRAGVSTGGMQCDRDATSGATGLAVLAGPWEMTQDARARGERRHVWRGDGLLREGSQAASGNEAIVVRAHGRTRLTGTMHGARALPAVR